MPPEVPMISTFCPAAMRPARRPCRAASPDSATTAACPKLSRAETLLVAGSRGRDDVPVLERHLVAEGRQALARAGVVAERSRVGVIGRGDHLHPQGLGYAAAGWVGHEHELGEPAGPWPGLPWPAWEGCVDVVKGVTGQGFTPW